MMTALLKMCPDCGTPTLPETLDQHGGVCPRCANPIRRKAPVQSVFVNGVEILGAENIAAALKARKDLPVYPPVGSPDRTRMMAGIAADAMRDGNAGRAALIAEAKSLGVNVDPDPIRDAIDRAAADWAEDHPE